MRSRVTRLTGVAAGAALVVASLVASGPANAAGGETGTVNITIVDDQGKPVNALVTLVPEQTGEQPIDPIGLEQPEIGKSSYSQEVPVGKYGILTMGGWSLMTCAGLNSCGLLAGVEPEVVGEGAFTVTDGGVVNYKVTLPSPKLSGTGTVGSPLVVDAPEFAATTMFSGGFEGIILFNALFGDVSGVGVTWKRDGVALRGENDTTYVPTGEDVGRSITAEVKLPKTFTMYLEELFAESLEVEDLAIFPRPLTLGPIVVTKKDSTTDVRIVGKRRVGHTPAAWITVKGGDRLNGWVTVTGTGDKPLKLRLREGFAKVELNKLRAGKRAVTATFDGTSTLNPSSDTATFKMKKAKDGKKKNKNKKSSKKR